MCWCLNLESTEKPEKQEWTSQGNCRAGTSDLHAGLQDKPVLKEEQSSIDVALLILGPCQTKSNFYHEMFIFDFKFSKRYFPFKRKLVSTAGGHEVRSWRLGLSSRRRGNKEIQTEILSILGLPLLYRGP